jgi:hypothetical protein
MKRVTALKSIAQHVAALVAVAPEIDNKSIPSLQGWPVGGSCGVHGQLVLLVQLGLVALSGMANVALAAPLSSPGILVSGAGSHFFKRCSTCPDEGSSDADTQGGNTVGSAETSRAASDSFSWLASGTLVGLNALPVLKARAEVQDPAVTDPTTGIGFVSATASAQGLQRYHYSGTEDGSYTITFSVNGLLDGDGENINAGLSVFSSKYDPFLEGEFQITRLAPPEVLTKSASSTNGSFSATSNQITFDIGAGDDFFVLAFLSANAFFSDSGSLPGVADASHTMTARFTAGDVSLLTAVPEPSIYGLMLAGFGAVGFAARRRTRHKTAI